MVVDRATRRILCTDFCEGKKHDFRLLKEGGTRFHPSLEVGVDTGYQGLEKLHRKTTIPKKRSKRHPLSKDDRKNNRKKSAERVVVEHVIGSVKRFRILSERYRNRRTRFGLRFNLIAAIHNFELDE